MLVWLNFIHMTDDDRIDLYSQDACAASHTKANCLPNLSFLNDGCRPIHHGRPGLHRAKPPRLHRKAEAHIALPPSYTPFDRRIR